MGKPVSVAVEPVPFSEAYYRRVIREFGYDTFDLRRFDFDLGGMRQKELNLRYLCHHHADRYLAAAQDRRAVTTGFGMSGPPHMATAAQMMSMVRLQRDGERCQIVLGDLDAYNGRNRSHHYTLELADRFRLFAIRLGFNPETGVLRNQAGYGPALLNMYLLGRYAADRDFDAAEEDNHAYYAAQGIVDATMSFRRKLSLALMTADFITLGQGYDAVLIQLGIDEHKYVRFAQQIAARLNEEAPLRHEFALTALYTRLNRGFGGHPKFSKSIPASAIGVETPNDEIRRLVISDDAQDPEASPVYQLMCQMSYCSHEDLLKLYRACASGSSSWDAERRRFIRFLVHVKEQWPT